MKVEEIERLLAEFYEGNTNEQEEELLKEAFRRTRNSFSAFFPGKWWIMFPPDWRIN